MQQFGETLLNGLSMGAIYALIALGFSLVYGVLKLLNFAHSEIFTIGAFLAYGTIRHFAPESGEAPFWVVPVALVTAGGGAGLAALVLERVAYRPLRGQPRVNVLLTAIGVSILLQSLGLKFLGARSKGVPPVELPIAPKLFAMVVMLVSLGVLWALVKRSLIGIKMRAVAESAEKAELSGIRPGNVYMFTFFAGGVFAGIGSVMWCLVYGSVNPQMGFELGLKAFVISVVGGIGSLPGTCTAALGIGVIDKMLETYLPEDLAGHRMLFLLATLLAVLVVRPQGLARSFPGSQGGAADA